MKRPRESSYLIELAGDLRATGCLVNILTKIKTQAHLECEVAEGSAVIDHDGVLGRTDGLESITEHVVHFSLAVRS